MKKMYKLFVIITMSLLVMSSCGLLEKNRIEVMSKMTSFNHEGEIIQIMEFKYDEYGNCIQNIQTDKNGEYITSTREYDRQGKIIKGTDTSADGNIINFYEYIHSEDDDYTMICYENDGTVGYKKIYEYDENGNYIVMHYENDGTVGSRESYEYDENGCLIKSVNWEKEDVIGTLIYKNEYSNGKIIRVETYEYEEVEDKETRCATEEYTYNEKGNLEKIVEWYDKSTIIYETYFTYNETNDKVSQKRYVCQWPERWLLYDIEYSVISIKN